MNTIRSRIRGFRIKNRIVNVVKWRLIHKKQKGSRLIMLSKLCGFARSLKNSAKAICFSKKLRYIRLQDDDERKMNLVPKGHLAVYVGEDEDDAHRVLVPVIYFNHPLFGDLLREAEKVYGFNYDGGIHVPCCISEFENVQTKISAVAGTGAGGGGGGGGDGGRVRRRWRISL